MKAITIVLDEEDYALIRYALNELESRRREQSIEAAHIEYSKACMVEAINIAKLNQRINRAFHEVKS